MGDCSTPQPKPPGGCATNSSADTEPEKAEPLLEQAAAQAQARQVLLEGRDSIVRFLRRTATGSPEWEREHLRSHAIEEEADSRTIIKEQIPAHSMSSPDTSTDTDSPTEGTRAHRSLSWPALLTTGHHDSSVYNASLSQAGTAPLQPLTSVFSTTVDSAIQYYNSAVDCPPSAVSPQPSLYKDLFVTADMANQYANKPKEHKPAMNNATTIAQVMGEPKWTPVQEEQTETANPPELSPCGKPTTLPIIKGRSSLTDQELGALSEQILSNLEEQINRTPSLTTTATATTATKHHEKDEAGGGRSVSTTSECPTNAQDLATVRASQDIMARALLCQSNKVELQLDLFQLLATYLLDVRTKVTNIENLLATTMMGAQCPSSSILKKLCDLPIILCELVEAVKLTPITDKATIPTLPHQRGHLSHTTYIQGQNIAIARAK
ncbi:hypothetical protein NDU88_006638 [Pleurodeles waltl]|uniref:Uncharacterized protein n=1 Tax=Pleurodeles waltl TaxID=8319 RepID=A0AAV7WY50_PLEWA|nr:hypothetical protein NDU88_006638 [Pleurodeles waltl]